MKSPMSVSLAQMAREVMVARGFTPDFPPAVLAEVAALPKDAPALAPSPSIKDLRGLLWSSIDNDTSRDLDQIEVAERLADGSTRVLVGIADVDALVSQASAIDAYAAAETTTVYAGVTTFPMLPEALSTGATSLLEDADRLAMVIEIIVGSDGAIQGGDVARAIVRNRAQLTYSGVGAWLEGGAAPPKVAASPDLQAQLRLQDETAQALRQARFQHG